MGELHMEDKKIKTKVLRPKFNNDLDIIELSRENIVDEIIISFGIISNCSLEDYESERMTFKQVIFKNVVFNKIKFKYIELMDVRFENCDLSNVDFNEASLHRVEFLNCK